MTIQQTYEARRKSDLPHGERTPNNTNYIILVSRVNTYRTADRSNEDFEDPIAPGLLLSQVVLSE